MSHKGMTIYRNWDDPSPFITVEYRARFLRPNGNYYVIGLKTDHADLDIYVSPTGKAVRVFKGRQEMKVVKSHEG